MICTNCNKEKDVVTEVVTEGVIERLCNPCKRKPRCPRCKKRQPSLTLVPNSSKRMCARCYRKVYL